MKTQYIPFRTLRYVCQLITERVFTDLRACAIAYPFATDRADITWVQK